MVRAAVLRPVRPGDGGVVVPEPVDRAGSADGHPLRRRVGHLPQHAGLCDLAGLALSEHSAAVVKPQKYCSGCVLRCPEADTWICDAKFLQFV